MPDDGTIRFRGGPGSLVRLDFQVRKGWSSATGMLRAQQIKSLLHHFNAYGG